MNLIGRFVFETRVGPFVVINLNGLAIFRASAVTNNRGPVAWSRTECDDMRANNTACQTKLDETQSAEINAYILMSR